MEYDDALLDEYERGKQIGKGAYGKVYLVTRKSDGQDFVSKQLSVSMLDDKELKVVQREIEVLSDLIHPYITRIVDCIHNEALDCVELVMEYCADGTLLHELRRRKKTQDKMDEEQIWDMFFHLLVALQYVHNKHILHRDLKSENIFLNEGIAKLGDFGLARPLESQSGFAETMVGTPYYISPEICEGKRYAYSSDVWSLGCVLYEMAALHVPFEAKNLCALVMKITDKPHQPLSTDDYSSDLVDLVNDMLNKDPKARPTVAEVLDNCPPMRLRKEAFFEDNAELLSRSGLSSTRGNPHSDTPRGLEPTPLPTAIWHWGNGSAHPRQVEALSEIPVRSVDIGGTGDKFHIAAVSGSGFLFTWGSGSDGQLGHGTNADNKQPRLVVANARAAACGTKHTLCLTDDGEVWSFGSNSDGQLGRGDEDDPYNEAAVVEELMGLDIVAVACGDFHSVALTEQGEVYTWGSNEFGQCGVGSEGDTVGVPTKLDVLDGYNIKSVACGSDNTMLLTDDGLVLGFGSAECDKLGFGHEDNVLEPTEVDGLTDKGVVQVACGRTHGLAITQGGQAYAFGDNTYGQLGLDIDEEDLGNGPVLLSNMGSAVFTRVACGDRHSLALTDNGVFAWGTGKYGLSSYDEDYEGNKAKFAPEVVNALFTKKIKSIAANGWQSICLAK